MRKFKDDRNRAYNDIFPEIGKGDVNISVLYPGTIKAFHRHQKQDDYWFVIKGNIRAVMCKGEPYVPPAIVPYDLKTYTTCGCKQEQLYNDVRVVNNTVGFVQTMPIVPVDLQIHYLGEGDILHIPAGYWHGLQVLGSEEAIMLYHITNKYNPNDPDEERTSWATFFDWNISRK